MTIPLVELSEFFNDIYPNVPGCPDALIENATRNAAIAFCEKTGIIQFEMDPISVVAGVSEYDLEAADELIVDRIESAVYDGEPLEILNDKLARMRYPKFQEYRAMPRAIFRRTSRLAILYPIPDANKTSSLYLTVILKPSPTTEYAPELLLDDHKAAIVAGAVSMLCMMPNKDWSNGGVAATNASMFAAAVSEGSRKARRADEAAVPVTRYGGIGGKGGRSFRKGWQK